MQVHCISVSENVWGGGPRSVGELPAGGILASQGTFSIGLFLHPPLEFGAHAHWGLGEIDGLLVSPGKASKLLSGHLITG